MKTITIGCPRCKHEFQYGLNELQRKLLFELITSDQKMMFDLGKMAAKAYLNIKKKEENVTSDHIRP